jgi:hypothetical protein
MNNVPHQALSDTSEKINYQLSLNNIELILVTLDAMNRLASDPSLTIPQALSQSTEFYRFDTPPAYPMDDVLFDTLYEPLFLYRYERGLLKPDDDDIQALRDALLGTYAYTNADMTGFNHEN